MFRHITIRHFSASSARASVDRLTVFGGGLMGSGIGQVAATNGVKVSIVDVTDKALENSNAIITKSLARIAKKKEDPEGFMVSVLDNIEFTTDVKRAVSDTQVVIEAIVEKLEAKQALFRELDGLAPPETLFASNTSSIGIESIASATSAARQRNFGGFHAFNPVPQMKLVEIISTPQTSPETTETLRSLALRMKKTPVACKDTPGFIVNRLLVPYLLEGVALFERGDASAEDIDTAMKLGAGVPMGPLELSDFVGLDTLAYIAKGWAEDAKKYAGKDPKYDIFVKENTILDKYVSEGKTGRKSGEGFFKYK